MIIALWFLYCVQSFTDGWICEQTSAGISSHVGGRGQIQLCLKVMFLDSLVDMETSSSIIMQLATQLVAWCYSGHVSLVFAAPHFIALLRSLPVCSVL